MYSNATAWLSHQQPPNQHLHDPQHVHHDGRPPSADAWKDRSGAAGTSQQTLDLSDFGLGDIPGEHVSLSANIVSVQSHGPITATCLKTLCSVGDHTSSQADVLVTVPSSSTSPPPQSFYGHNNFQQQSFFLPNAPASYNPMPYGSTSWPTQPNPVPLSNYSSLNGATTGASGSSHQQQPPPPPVQMMIE